MFLSSTCGLSDWKGKLFDSYQDFKDNKEDYNLIAFMEDEVYNTYGVIQPTEFPLVKTNNTFKKNFKNFWKVIFDPKTQILDEKGIIINSIKDWMTDLQQ